jgi:hypothetical protein
MTSGERRVAERLEDKLDDDYLLWYDVPMGPRHAHPDFCVMHPRRGILVLEVKDWKLSTIQQADKQTWEIIPTAPRPSSTRWSRPANTRTRWSTRWSATRNWCRATEPHAGQAGLSLELRRGAAQHHPQAV